MAVLLSLVHLWGVQNGLEAVFGQYDTTTATITTSVARKVPKKHSTIMIFRGTKTPNSTAVVGRQGPAIEKAKTHGLAQKMKGIPVHLWDIIETSECDAQKQAAFLNGTKEQREQRKQLPFAILIGVQKGGTTALYNYLDRHPEIASSTKELWFLDEHLDTIVKRNEGIIPRLEARQAYRMLIRKNLKAPLIDLDEGKLLLDLTPNYMFENNRLPARIQCVVPWVKLFCLLRNPIDRARSQYDMKLRFVQGRQNKYGNPIPTFEEYIQNDIAALQETGVLQDWTKIDFDEFFDSPEGWHAWDTYLNSGLNAPVGMSLYALQLVQFLKLPNHFLAVTSEDLQTKTLETYKKVLKFLGLRTTSLLASKSINKARRKSKMSNETHHILQEIFEPYNHKLAELLGNEWEGVWAKKKL